MNITYKDTRKSDIGYIIAVLVLAITLGICAMTGNIGVKLDPNKNTCKPGIHIVDLDLTPCVMGHGE